MPVIPQALERLVGHWPWLSPAFNGVAAALVTAGLGLFLVRSYRSHTWLFQTHDARRGYENWIEFLVPFVRGFQNPRYRSFVSRSLGRVGAAPSRTVDHFLAEQILLACVAFVGVFCASFLVWGPGFVVPALLALLALVLPALHLHERSRTRVRRILRDLPYFLDTLSLSLTAGLDFNGALSTTLEILPPSPLREEFSRIQRNIRFGKTRRDALLEFDARMETLEIRGFVQTLVQSLELGTDLAGTLQTLSSGLSIKRFQRAEEEAGKISVRMMVPMICFILPVVLLLMIGPLFLSFLHSGI